MFLYRSKKRKKETLGHKLMVQELEKYSNNNNQFLSGEKS